MKIISATLCLTAFAFCQTLPVVAWAQTATTTTKPAAAAQPVATTTKPAAAVQPVATTTKPAAEQPVATTTKPAAEQPAAATTKPAAAAQPVANQSQPLSYHSMRASAEGEVRKIDLENGKVAIKHSAIKALDMPTMTMVFTAQDKDILTGVKPGDRIKFMVLNENGKLFISDIQPYR